jgi:hypothetical protein
VWLQMVVACNCNRAVIVVQRVVAIVRAGPLELWSRSDAKK